jgi:DNA-binding PadR family transcriptional regulator
MENKGWIEAEWRLTENNRRAKYYRLTPAGKRQLAAASATWDTFADAMTRIMRARPESL